MNKKFFLPFLVSLLAIIIFWPTVKTYFFQDDWVFLSYVYKKSFIDIFRYHPESIYRPIGQQLFFWINSKLFDLNSTNYHLTALLVHSINIFLLSRLIFSLTYNKLKNGIIFILLLIYALNPLHFVALNWLTQINLEISVTFSLSSLLIFDNYQRKKKLTLWFTSIFFLILALLSHEIALVLPIAAILIFGWNKDLLLMLPVIGFIGMRKYLINPFPLSGEYSLSFNPILLAKTIKWYFLRSLMIPEGIRILPEIIKYLSLIPAGLMLILFNQKLLLPAAIFGIATLPVLFLSRHLLAGYGTLAIALMIVVLSQTVGKTKINKLGIVLISAAIFAASFFTVKQNFISHWSVTRGKIAEIMREEYQRGNNKMKQKIKEKSSDYQIDPELYFATMMSREFEVLDRK